ncbi:MAG: hypothetical protein PVH21_14570 [Myxococcales bacterium]
MAVLRCYSRPTLMHFVSTRLAIFALVSLATRPNLALAQQEATDLELSARGDPDIVVQEPRTPDRDALAHNAELLDELLERSTEQTLREQKFAAAAGIMGGTILIGLASWRLIEDEPSNQYTRGLGVMFMTLGMGDLTTGIFAATRIPHEKRRLERWQKARKDGITAAELAHFEGELQSANETRQGDRLLVRWNGLTHAMAGIFVIASTPFPSTLSRADRVTGYVIGSVFVATGAAAFGLSFRKTPSEKAWLDYKAQRAPMPGHELTFRISPAISRQGFGVSVQGRF